MARKEIPGCPHCQHYIPGHEGEHWLRSCGHPLLKGLVITVRGARPNVISCTGWRPANTQAPTPR